MKILFLSDACDEYLQTKIKEISKDYESVTYYLNEENIKPCTGCFCCWTKTPGNCIITSDKANEINKQFIQCDVLIILSDVQYGGYSYHIKKYLDRSIPNLLPFFKTINNEMHHKKRYSKYPSIISVGYSENLAEDEKNTFNNLVFRNSINLYSPKSFSFPIKSQIEKESTINNISKILKEEF